ncbi:hypothetical protein ACQP1K_04790 [Sphaerimonospora sp. CA-214678]|uniref:hypothetical protein n=1 Tax=Sphaerimonospora sp. CA-214678 TaxID=3240029 RepID=UPI003D8F729B
MGGRFWTSIYLIFVAWPLSGLIGSDVDPVTAAATIACVLAFCGLYPRIVWTALSRPHRDHAPGLLVPLYALAAGPAAQLGQEWLFGAVFADADLAVPAPALVAAYLALVAAVVTGVAHWSRREGWGERHRLALAGGALLTYTWRGFVQPPVVEASAAVDLAGDVVFALAAVVLLIVAAIRVRQISVQALRIDVP